MYFENNIRSRSQISTQNVDTRLYSVFLFKRYIILNVLNIIRTIYILFKEVDMAAAFIPVLPGLDDIVKWGIDLTQFQYVVLMKRPKESATGSGLLAPFEIEVLLS